MCVVNWLPLRSRPYSGGASEREGLSLPLSSFPEHSAGEGRKEGLLFPPAVCWVFPLGGRKACLEIGSSPAWRSVWFCFCSFWLCLLAQAPQPPPTPCAAPGSSCPPRAPLMSGSVLGEQSELLPPARPWGCGGCVGRASEQRHGAGGREGKGRLLPARQCWDGGRAGLSRRHQVLGASEHPAC